MSNDELERQNDDAAERHQVAEQQEDAARRRAHAEWLSFADLQALGVIPNWTTLLAWQKDFGFPVGRLLGPNSRRWSRQEINVWLASRPVARADFGDEFVKPKGKKKTAA
jgi:hypothetical protein